MRPEKIVLNTIKTARRNSVHHITSHKSFTSALIGICLKQGFYRMSTPRSSNSSGRIKKPERSEKAADHAYHSDHERGARLPEFGDWNYFSPMEYSKIPSSQL
jgi:hypothetical protein